MYLSTDSSLQLKSSQYQSIDLPVGLQGNLRAYNVLQNKFVQVVDGGSYTILFQTTVENLDTTVYTGFVRAVADVGTGFAEIPGSTTYVTLVAGGIQTIFFSTVVYLPPNAKIRIEGLSVDGGNLQLRDGSSKLLVSQIETNVSSFVGLPEFGRFYKYISDNQEVITTSTIFSQRLAAVTVDLPPGMYRVQVTFEWDMSNPGVGFESQLVLDNVTTLDTYSTVPVMTGTYQNISFFRQVELSEGEHIFSLRTRVMEATRALHTKNVRMEFYRTS